MSSSKLYQNSSLRKYPNIMANLPDDVLYSNIFIRLRAKQVAQLRSLSKIWNVLLSQSSFIKSHLDHSIHNNDNETLIVFYDSIFYENEYFTIHASRSPYLERINFIKLPVSTLSGLNFVIGSVNGLICFSSYTCVTGHVVNIWNPSLSALIALPNSNIASTNDHRQYCSVFRFGYDPKTDDYKVIMLTFLMTKYIIDEWVPVKVYSVRKCCWESISERFPSHITEINNLNEVVGDGHDGHVHLLCNVDANQILETIVTFDLSVETFSEISLPDFVQCYNRNRTNVLGVLFQKLCVMSCVRGGDFQVWVMDEYGVTTSWVKYHVFSQFNGNIIPIGYSLHGEFLFGFGDHRLALYNPNANVVKLFEIIEKQFDCTKIVHYVDSLVWVAPGKCGSSITSLKIEN